MKWLRVMMVLSVLGLWLGASNHCLLEKVTALEFLVCSPSAEGQPHQENDCQKDSCASVEHAAFKAEHNQLTVFPPQALQPANLFTMASEELLPVFIVPEDERASAATLPAAWRFHYRTAAPPRAPSFPA